MTLTPLHPNKKDSQQVEVLAGMGATEEFIAKHLNISPTLLHEHYSRQLAHGIEESNLQVAKAFHEMATSKEFPTMTVAWMKMRAGWSDNTPSSTTDTDDSSLDEAKEKLLKLLNRAHNSNNPSAA